MHASSPTKSPNGDYYEAPCSAILPIIVVAHAVTGANLHEAIHVFMVSCGLDGLKSGPDACIKLPTKLLDRLLSQALHEGFHACDGAMLNTGYPVGNLTCHLQKL